MLVIRLGSLSIPELLFLLLLLITVCVLLHLIILFLDVEEELVLALIFAAQESVVFVLGDHLGSALLLIPRLIIFRTASQVVLLSARLVLQGMELFRSAEAAWLSEARRLR